jgi:flavin-dependent dehydrogenase
MSDLATLPPSGPDYDAIVIGGGPAGSTTATLLAQQGHRVLLTEREQFPRFKIGESLMPQTFSAFERLGIVERLRASAFPKKYSVQFYSPSGKASQPFYFYETNPEPSSQTWQVRRSEFDQLLIDNAREHGVEVRFRTNVKRVLFAGERAVGVEAELADGSTATLRSRVVVDASGQAAMLARSRGLVEPDPELCKAAVFTHVRGAVRDPGIDEGATLVIHTNQGQSWFWFIPLPDGVTSVGVVGAVDYLIGRKRDEGGEALPRMAVAGGDEGRPQRIFEEELARCPALAGRLGDAAQVEPMRVLKEFSYRSRQIAGDGWVLVGDAFGFLDPIYSSGVLLALRSGEMAADAIHAALVADDPSAARLGAFGDRYAAGVEAFRKIVHAYYAPGFSFAKFLRAYPERRLAIVDMLTGDVFDRDYAPMFAEMATMCDLPGDWPRLVSASAA